MYRHYYWGEFGGRHGGWRARRGDMGPIILSVLKEKPMHGYEVISRLEEKSHGMWRPSAGSVYPNLQMLEEQDLVTSKDDNGKKVYFLTNKGKKQADEHEKAHKERWEKRSAHAKSFKYLKTDFVDIAHAIKEIAIQGDETKSEELKKILKETREKLAKLADNTTEK